MKKNTGIIIALAIVIVAVIAGAAVGYRLLSNKAENPSPTEATVLFEQGDNADSGETTAADTADRKTAASFTVYDDNGNEVELSDRLGKPVVVNFWASWCPPCRSELPYFDKLYQELGDEVNFMMVNLTDETETVDTCREFIAENGYTFPVYYDADGNAAYAYSIRSIPLTVFIDADGNLVDEHLGAMDEATLRAYLEQLK